MNASAEIFYSGDTKGMAGESVHLSINARAGTMLESIDIVPDYAAVADVLELVGLTSMPALTDDGFGQCENDNCAFAYVFTKSFSSDTLLATINFTIAADAPVGPVPFRARVFVGENELFIPPPQNFEVLPVPEPQHWVLILAGLGVALGASKVRRRA